MCHSFGFCVFSSSFDLLFRLHANDDVAPISLELRVSIFRFRGRRCVFIWVMTLVYSCRRLAALPIFDCLLADFPPPPVLQWRPGLAMRIFPFPLQPVEFLLPHFAQPLGAGNHRHSRLRRVHRRRPLYKKTRIIMFCQPVPILSAIYTASETRASHRARSGPPSHSEPRLLTLSPVWTHMDNRLYFPLEAINMVQGCAHVPNVLDVLWTLDHSR
ncbi:hypothetical protein B0H12DRAFT_1142029 [Mycena haematopus]|nr:hypothetical protein B0H12DRAFT_1142029 [Mycena haematopus]